VMGSAVHRKHLRCSGGVRPLVSDGFRHGFCISERTNFNEDGSEKGAAATEIGTTGVEFVREENVVCKMKVAAALREGKKLPMDLAQKIAGQWPVRGSEGLNLSFWVPERLIGDGF